jgi:ABC-type phosphate/phosphonate transport system substrate-binding protein
MACGATYFSGRARTSFFFAIVLALSGQAQALEPISFGIFPGSVNTNTSLSDVLERYEPLARYLETKTPKTKISITAIRSPATFKQHVTALRYRVIFVNPEIATVASDVGYKFTLAREESIVGVVIAPSTSSYKNLSELAGKTVLANKEAMVTTLMRAELHTRGVKVKWAFNAIPQEELPAMLKMGFGDGAAVVRKEYAERLMRDQPGAWRIIGASAPERGFMLGFRGDTPVAIVSAYTTAFSQLTPGTPEHDAVLAGFDSGKIVKSRYIAVDNGALEPMRQRLEALKRSHH